MTPEQPKISEIPLLTQVYKPKSSVEKVAEADSQKKQELKDRAETILPRFAHTDLNLSITPEFIARVTGHVRPRLEAEITASILYSVSSAIKKEIIAELKQEVLNAQNALQINTINFVDKTKADLKTELPRMYQASAELVQLKLSDNIATMQTKAVSTVDRLLSDVLRTTVQAASDQIEAHVETLQAESSATLAQHINAQTQDFQVSLLSEHQANLAQQLNVFFDVSKQQAEQLIQALAETLTTQANERLQTDFTQQMPAIYAQALVQEQAKIIGVITDQLTQSLQTFQSQLINEHQMQLNQSLASNFDTHIEQAKTQVTTHLQSIQAESLLSMQNNLGDAVPVIYNQASDEVKLKFTQDMAQESNKVRQQFLDAINADLPDVQTVLAQNINQILATTLPALQEDIRKQLTLQLQDLLLNVKFVLPGGQSLQND